MPASFSVLVYSSSCLRVSAPLRLRGHTFAPKGARVFFVFIYPPRRGALAVKFSGAEGCTVYENEVRLSPTTGKFDQENLRQTELELEPPSRT